MSNTIIEVCGLNVEANPHPTSIYRNMLKGLSNIPVNSRGSDFAKITSPNEHEKNKEVLFGRILVWTDIDLRGRWLDLKNNDYLSEDAKRLISIPEDARPNYRTFNYIFDEKRHHIWYESKNVLNERLGPSTALRIFRNLFSGGYLAADSPTVEVTPLPEEGAVDRILSMPLLRILRIRVVRPNPDGPSPAKERILAQLNASGARQMEVELVKAPEVNHLTPTQDTKELAEVASESGFVRGRVEM